VLATNASLQGGYQSQSTLEDGIVDSSTQAELPVGQPIKAPFKFKRLFDICASRNCESEVYAEAHMHHPRWIGNGKSLSEGTARALAHLRLLTGEPGTAVTTGVRFGSAEAVVN